MRLVRFKSNCRRSFCRCKNACGSCAHLRSTLSSPLPLMSFSNDRPFFRDSVSEHLTESSRCELHRDESERPNISLPISSTHGASDRKYQNVCNGQLVFSIIRPSKLEKERHMVHRPVCLVMLGGLALFGGEVFAQTPCDAVANMQLPRTTITSATMVAGGPLPNAQGINVPAHCEVKGVIRPTKDSEIQFAVWLPPAGWNGKYLQVGNGGWAGAIPYRAMVDSLVRGYAVAGTDDGHDGGAGAAWAIGHPEKLIDFGHRAVHETNLQSRAVVRAFYGREPSLSYFVGCSDGGREALMEAQRYPDEFNGIIAGAPANNWSHLFTGFLWNEQAALNTPGSSIPPAKLPAIQNAVHAACDSLDGVKDGLLENPRACRFDPSVLLCKANDNSECLTASQVEQLKKIYAGPKNPRTGEQIFPGY